MSLSVTVALSIVVILAGIAVPALMLVVGSSTGLMRVWTAGFITWLCVVFAWVLLQFHLYSLAPAYFQDPGPWDAINGWPAAVAVVLVVVSYLATFDD